MLKALRIASSFSGISVDIHTVSSYYHFYVAGHKTWDSKIS